jgi:flagellar motor switch protein FliN/FliY
MSTASDTSSWLLDQFSSQLATVFETMAGERPSIEIEPVGEMPAEAALRWQQLFSGVAGAMWVSAAEVSWTLAGGHILKAAGIEDSDAASIKSTYFETISQALSGAAGAMGARAGHEIACAHGEESAATPADATWAMLRINLGADTASIAIGIDTALVAALEASLQAAAQPPEPPKAALAAAGAGFSGPLNSKTFELLLDVEIPVSVSFGRAQVPLKDVLKLTTGSIVELNRSILEPVEVIVNNCVIARGEVVVVEGNFGVRIQHVISRQERLRTLN